MEDYKNEAKNLISDFNEAKFQILRLHSAWQLCNTYKRGGNFDGLKSELDNIWDELCSKSQRKYGDDRDKLRIDEIDKRINKFSNDKSRLYAVLRIKYRILKMIQEDVGMGGRMTEEGRDMMDD